jgi:hypothetical protein
LAGGGLVQSAPAQPAPPPPMHDEAAPPPHGPGPHGPGMEGMPGGMMGMMMEHRPGGPHEQAEMMHRMMHRMRTFSLLWTAPDRNLSAADVQKIVEGVLLWHGNHTWKVTNVQEQGDRVAFSLATQEGGTIASFTMDRHTGRVERTG